MVEYSHFFDLGNIERELTVLGFRGKNCECGSARFRIQNFHSSDNDHFLACFINRRYMAGIIGWFFVLHHRRHCAAHLCGLALATIRSGDLALRGADAGDRLMGTMGGWLGFLGISTSFRYSRRPGHLAVDSGSDAWH